MTDNIYQIIGPQKILCGAGALNNLSEEVRNYNVHKALIVTDPIIFSSDLTKPVQDQLAKANVAVDIFSDAEPEPTIIKLNSAAAELQKGKYELLIGVGGGSSIDTAKGLSVLLAHGGKTHDYLGTNKVPGPAIPVVAIPTTAGTGSEVTNIAIFSDTEQEIKIGIVSPFLLAKLALVDPELTYRCPQKVAAASGIDALVHAIECFTGTKANDFSDSLALRAMKIISNNLKTVIAKPANEQARNNMSEAAMLAGLAFGNSGVAAVHALAYPLGARFHVSHGVSNGLLLPYVMEYNIPANPEKYAIVAQMLGQKIEGLDATAAAKSGVEAVKLLVANIGLPNRLRDVGVTKESLPDMAKATMDVTRLLANNPKKLSLEDVSAIWENAW